MSFRVRTALAASCALLAGCGSFSSSATTEIDISTEAPTTTAVEVETGSSVESVTVTTYRPQRALPEGSGCTPDDPESLPGGRWFGFLIDVRLSSFTFDLACAYTGDQAAVAAAEDGIDDFDENLYVRNDVVERLTIETNPGISLKVIDNNGDDEATGEFYPQWYVSAPTGIPIFMVRDSTQVKSLVLVAS